MQVYVDESGDPGMKHKPGSSPVFVVSAILFEDDESARECRARIRDLHKRLGWGPRQEFKFNKTDNEIKDQFFEAVGSCDFMHVSVVLNKKKLIGPGFQFKDSFYKYTTRLVFSNAKPHLTAASIVMDQCGSREFRDQMSKYLKTHTADSTGDSPIKSVRTEKSHACELVQLADMVVGAVARSVQTHRPNAGKYRAMVAHRELSVQVWPR